MIKGADESDRLKLYWTGSGNGRGGRVGLVVRFMQVNDPDDPCTHPTNIKVN
jgi:hypothetical protein